MLRPDSYRDAPKLKCCPVNAFWACPEVIYGCFGIVHIANLVGV